MGPIEWLAAGDWNGDGQGDLALGAYQSGGWPPTSETAEDGLLVDFYTGQVAVLEGPFLGGPIDPDNGVAWLIGEGRRHVAGTAVERAGDINGDGLEDLFVGAPGFIHPEVGLQTGAAYVMLAPFVGEMSLSEARTRWISDDYVSLGQFGGRLRGVGDVAFDETPDLLAGGTSRLPYLLDGSAVGEQHIGVDVGPLFIDSSVYGLLGGGDLNGDGTADFGSGASGITTFVLGPVPQAESVYAWEPRLDWIALDTPDSFQLEGGAFVHDTNADNRTDIGVAGWVWGNPTDRGLLYLGR